jgi:YHS domain-containing protein
MDERRSRDRSRTRKKGVLEMKDPVCGMAVDADSAAAAWEHDGVTYLFCSAGCMESFRKDPQHYLNLDDADRHM